MCHKDVFKGVLVSDVDITEAEATRVTSLVGGGKEGDKRCLNIVSRKQVSEAGPIDHCTHVCEVVDRTKIFIY